MPKKKGSYIPDVDIIKSGINMNDKYEKYRAPDGRIKIGQSKKIKEVRENLAVSELAEQEKKLEKLRAKMDNLNLDKGDIKDIKNKLKKKKKKKNKDKKKKNKD